MTTSHDRLDWIEALLKTCLTQRRLMPQCIQGNRKNFTVVTGMHR